MPVWKLHISQQGASPNSEKEFLFVCYFWRINIVSNQNHQGMGSTTPHASQTPMMHLVGKCAISTQAWALAILATDTLVSESVNCQNFLHSSTNVFMLGTKYNHKIAAAETSNRVWSVSKISQHALHN